MDELAFPQSHHGQEIHKLQNWLINEWLRKRGFGGGTVRIQSGSLLRAVYPPINGQCTNFIVMASIGYALYNTIIRRMRTFAKTNPVRIQNPELTEK